MQGFPVFCATLVGFQKRLFENANFHFPFKFLCVGVV
ncbi:MAG: hypothetical protein EZS26_001688 [Candidatus Ordinivivax streblomastigis]|uniref:Uncharacterized protein n=1 Tax=Candidatus Ordinivivax streblomastigis TaxID=2540710 RepID=A0A5M8P0Y0_9BACT|nr:MAG: hypothetical protein EZS26_001688 [Candidatus Ordinivivax streblomastigis]